MNPLFNNGSINISDAVGLDYSPDGYFMVAVPPTTATVNMGMYISQDFVNWYLVNGTAGGTANDIFPASALNLSPGIVQAFDGVFYIAADGNTLQRGIVGTGSVLLSTNALQTMTNARGNFTGGNSNAASQLSKYVRSGNSFFAQWCSSGTAVTPGYGGANLVAKPFGIGRTPVVETVKL